MPRRLVATFPTLAAVPICNPASMSSVVEVSYPGPGAHATILSSTNFQRENRITRRSIPRQGVIVVGCKGAFCRAVTRNIEGKVEIDTGVVENKVNYNNNNVILVVSVPHTNEIRPAFLMLAVPRQLFRSRS
jgi:hypothetical protein